MVPATEGCEVVGCGQSAGSWLGVERGIAEVDEKHNLPGRRRDGTVGGRGRSGVTADGQVERELWAAMSPTALARRTS